MNKIQIISDQNNKSLTIKKVLIKKIENTNPSKYEPESPK